MGQPRWEPPGKGNPHGRWLVEFRRPKRKVKRFPCKAEGEREKERQRKAAQRWADDWEAKQTTKETLDALGLSLPEPAAPVASARLTFAHFTERFMRWMADSQAAPFTIRNYRSSFDTVLLEAFKGDTLQDITPARVDALRAGLRRLGLDPTAPLACLSSALSWAVEEGLLERNPCHRPRKRYRAARSAPRPPARSHSREQRAALLDAMPRGPERVAVVLAGWAGLRRREILGLHPGDFDLEAHDLFVQRQLQIVNAKPLEKPPKYNSIRHIPLAELVIAELRPWIERAVTERLRYLLQKASTGLPPTWEGGNTLRKDGKRTPPNRLKGLLEKASKAAGIDPPATLRTLRATAHTLWREAGLPGLQIEIWIGHSLRGIGGKAVGMTPVSAKHYQGEMRQEIDRSLLN